jgi:purine-binding chemotaxis protein CheW
MAEQMKTNDLLRYIRCTTGSETYAMDMASVYSIQRSDNLLLEPSADGILGRFPVRDEQAPVYGLAESLGQPGQSKYTGRRVVLLNPLPGRIGMWGLLVDQVSQVVSTTRQALSPLPVALCGGVDRYFEAVLLAGDELVLMLEPAGIHPDRSRSPEGVMPASVFMKPLVGDPPERRLPSARASRQQKQLIVFTLPGEEYGLQFALSITQVLEILAPLPVIPVPGAAPYLHGLVNWRNRPVPMIDLRRRLDLTGASEPGLARLMVVRAVSRKQEQVFGFLVHPVMHMLRLPVDYRASGSLVPIPAQFVKSVVEIDGKLTVIPYVSNILTV